MMWLESVSAVTLFVFGYTITGDLLATTVATAAMFFIAIRLKKLAEDNPEVVT